MSRKMSKYVCDQCSSALSTKHALQRHKGTDRCLKNQRDNSKHKLVEFKEPSVQQTSNLFDYKPICDQEIKTLASPKRTIFRRLFGDGYSPIRKVYHHKEFQMDNDHSAPLKTLTISEDNTIGHMLHKLVLSLPVQQEHMYVYVDYNHKNVFNMSVESLALLGINLNKIPITDMIFGEQTFIPLGTITIGCSGNTNKFSVNYHTYILTKEEAKRTTAPRELFFNKWFEANIVNDTNAPLLIKPTHAYVADIYYGGDDINPFYRGELNDQGVNHYNCVPETMMPHKWDMDNLLFSSLIPPGECFFENGTEEPVVIRYIALMRLDDGKIYLDDSLYGEHPCKVERRLIAERLNSFKPGQPFFPNFPHRITNNIYHEIGTAQLWNECDGCFDAVVPVQWSDTPSSCEYPVWEPDWNLYQFPLETDPDIKKNIEALKKYCAEQHPNFRVAPIKVSIAHIDGTYQALEKYYCYMVDGKWYGINNLNIDSYLNFHVPMNQELWDKLKKALSGSGSD